MTVSGRQPGGRLTGRELFDAGGFAVLHFAPVAAGLSVDLEGDLHIEALRHYVETEATHVLQFVLRAFEHELVVDLQRHQAAHFAALHLGVEAVHGDLDDVGGGALDRHVDGGALGGVADVDVSRVDLGNVAAAAVEVLGVTVLADALDRFGDVALHARVLLEVGADELTRLLTRDLFADG